MAVSRGDHYVEVTTMGKECMGQEYSEGQVIGDFTEGPQLCRDSLVGPVFFDHTEGQQPTGC